MTQQDDWPETRQRFRHIAAQEGIYAVADKIPAHPTTVYRLLAGDSSQPTRAVRAGVERVVQEHQEPQED